MYGPPECRPAAPPYACARRCATSANQSPCAGRTHHVRTSKSNPSSSQADSAPAPRALSSSVGRSSTRASKRDRPSRHGRPSIARLREVLPGRTLVPIPHQLPGARLASRLALLCVHLIREGEIEWCVQAYLDRSQLGSVKIAEEISNNPNLRSFGSQMVQISVDPVNAEGTTSSTYVQTVNELPRRPSTF